MNDRKCTWMTAVAVAVMACAGAAQGALLNLQTQRPAFTFNNTGTIVYTAANGAFSLQATPLRLLQLPPNPTLDFVLPGQLRIEATIDPSTGTALPGGTLVLEGTVGSYSGTLLTGTIMAFGWGDLTPGSVTGTDQFDFIVQLTGGALSDQFQDGYLSVLVTTEFSNFAGDFTVDFNGTAKGNAGFMCAREVAGAVTCVTGADVLPIAGATITALDNNGGAVATTTSGLDGSYTLSLPAPADYTIQVTPPAGTRLCAGNGDTVSLRLTCDEDKVADFCICPCLQSITGTVLCTSDHQPIAGATITVTDSSGNNVGATQTGSDGDYEIPNLPAGAYTVTVTPPADGRICDGTPTQQNVILECDRDATADFCVCPCVQSIKGTIVCTSNGETIEGATVTLLDSAHNPLDTATTGSDGAYVFADLAPGNYIVTVAPPAGSSICDSQPTETPVTLGCGQDSTVDFCVCAKDCPPGEISGKVACIKGWRCALMKGVTVTLYHSDGTEADSTQTDYRGRYTFEDLAPGVYKIEITPIDDTAPCDDNPKTVTLDCGEKKDIDFCLCPTCPPGGITGKVECRKDWCRSTPVANVTVTVYTLDGTEVASAETDADGRYAIDNLPPNYYKVRVHAPDGSKSCEYKDTKYACVKCGDEDRVDFCLCITCPPGKIVGVVACTEACRSIPMPDVTVLLYKDGSKVATARTDEDGRYCFNRLAAGDYKVKISPPDGTRLCDYKDSRHVTLKCGDTDSANFCLCPSCPPGRITGKVACTKDCDKAVPVQGVTVALYKENGTKVATDKTDSNGRYNFDDVPAGEYKVKVFAPDGTKLCDYKDTRYVTLKCGDTDAVDFCVCSICSPGKIVGKVACTEGCNRPIPVKDVTVTLYKQNGTKVATDKTDSEGRYRFDDLPAGEYKVKISTPDGTKSCDYKDTRYVTLKCGDTDAVDFCVCSTCKPGKIVGEINYKHYYYCAPLKDVTVTLYKADGTKVARTETNYKGEYRFDDLPAGSYQVKVSAPWDTRVCDSNPKSTTLTCDDVDCLNFTLTKK